MRSARRLASLVTLVLLLFGPGLSRADQAIDDETPVVPERSTTLPPAPPVPNAEAEPATTPTAWYGWQLMLSDAATFALVNVLSESDSGDLVTLAFLGGPALIHIAHGRPQAALKSLGLRCLAPIGGAATGMAVGLAFSDDSKHDSHGGFWDERVLVGIAIGAVVGELAALVLDYSVLSAGDPPPTRERRSSTMGVALVPRSDGLTLSLGGTF
jgi:hypothetical protein